MRHDRVFERGGIHFLYVRQQLIHEAGHPVLRPLKTRNSQRAIPLNSLMVDVVTGQQLLQKRLGSRGAFGLSFTSTAGTPVCANNLRRWMRRELPKPGLGRCVPHDLRRGFVSIQVAANADVKTVSTLLGRADISTTMNVYIQATTRRQEEVMAQMERLILSVQDRVEAEEESGTTSERPRFDVKNGMSCCSVGFLTLPVVVNIAVNGESGNEKDPAEAGSFLLISKSRRSGSN